MGTGKLDDAARVARFEVSALDGVHRLDVRWPTATPAPTANASTPTGAASTPAAEASTPTAVTSTQDGDGAVSTPGSRTATGATRSDDTTGPGDDSGARPGRDETYAWLLVVPLAATLVGIGIGLVFGFGVFDTGTPGDVSLLPYVALVPYFLAGLAGTIWLVEDAHRLAETGADWQPNPWLYVVVGTVVLEAVAAVPVVRGDVTTGVFAYLAGGLVLAGVLSSVVVGPVYFLRRRRHLDAS